MPYPERSVAHELLEQAHAMNTGPWYGHSLFSASAAEIIGGALGMDSERCYVSGLLHDIGRYEGVTFLRHAWSGYYYLAERGYDDCARCALTHSFLVKDINSFSGKHDLDEPGQYFLQDYIRNAEYDDYDRLVQLCDALAFPDGFSIVEQRIVNVVLRHGFNDYTREKWQALFAIKAGFDRRLGRNLYALLPGLAENIVG